MYAANSRDALDQLQDHSQITDLVFRLGVCLDEGRFGEMGALFSEDATASTPSGTARGRDSVVAQAERNHRPGFAMQSSTSNVLVDIDGDRATVRANSVVQIAPPAPTDAPVPDALAPKLGFTLGQVYRIECVRTADGWRLAGVQTVPVWMAGERPARRTE